MNKIQLREINDSDTRFSAGSPDSSIHI